MDQVPAPGGRQLFVSADCQTGPLVSAFRAIFPTDFVTGAIQVRDKPNEFAQSLRNADIWIRYFDISDVMEEPEIAEAAGGVTPIDIVPIAFRAFHPDYFYIAREPSVQVKQLDHSGIATWCYTNNVDLNDTLRLFNRDVFCDLGYFDYWPASETALRSRFEYAKLDFAKFFFRIKRSGCFMHTINHPKINAVVALAKLASIKIGANPNVWDQPIELTDTFADFHQWPVYPEIARYFAIPGSYEWVEHSKRRSLREFIEASWQNFEEEGGRDAVVGFYAPAEVSARFDKVLGARIRSRA